MRIENFESVEEPNLQDTSTPIDHSDKTPEEEAKQEAKLEALESKRKARKATGDGSKPTSKRKASSKTPKQKKSSTKPTKKSSKKVSAPKKSKAPKAKPAKGPGRGIRADGKPRRKPGTNPPKDEERARFGRKMAKARKEKGWTQGQLAEKLGLSQPGVANIERGVCGGGPETPTRKAIEKKLGL